MRKLIILCALLLAACQPSGPTRQFSKGAELAYYNFSEANSWEQGSYGGAASLRVSEGVYRIEVFQGDNALWWGQWGDTYTNVVIDVDVEQASERNENAYGVMCRVRGAVGQRLIPDSTLAALAQETPEAAETAAPTQEPTPEVTEAATLEPTDEATDAVTAEPTDEATSEATDAVTAESTDEATPEATDEATAEPTDEATDAATPEATDEATVEPTVEPTDEATPEATEAATDEATDEATPEATEAAGVGETATTLEGDGYVFLIQGTGRFAIMRASGRSLMPLVDWRESDAIVQGPGENRIRVICNGTYLALFVNDRFLAEANDDTYAAGQVALAASAANRLGTRIEFDNLTISEVAGG